MLYKAFALLALTKAGLCAESLQITDIKAAEAHRLKTIQKLHVAQAPVHSKQEKASPAEIAAYAEAVTEAVSFQKWVASNGSCSVWLSRTGNASNDPINYQKYVKIIWEIHDAEIRTTAPFTRKDIGIAIKMMNDVRELFMLPVKADGRNSMPQR